MLIYIQRHPQFAGKWIYNGYAHAWAYLDHQVKFINSLDEVNTSEKYKIFCTEGLINNSNFDKIQKSYFTFLYCQANDFPQPWGSHPNYQCHVDTGLIDKINNAGNITKWTFSSELKHYTKWKDVISLPLAFDNINYLVDQFDDYQYDVCFIGAMVNNGFSEKESIMKEVLNEFIKSDLKCAFSVGQDISHELENEVIIKSKVSLNIHDAYQRVLGYDSNERTFKSLGINGILVCDEVNQVKSLFPDVFLSNDPKKLIEKTIEYCKLSPSKLKAIKKENINFIESNHTYIKRVEKLLSLI